MYDFPVLLLSNGAPAIRWEGGANCMGPHHATPSSGGPSTRFRQGPKAVFGVVFLSR
jgi:hypothetical protein